MVVVPPLIYRQDRTAGPRKYVGGGGRHLGMDKKSGAPCCVKGGRCVFRSRYFIFMEGN